MSVSTAKRFSNAKSKPEAWKLTVQEMIKPLGWEVTQPDMSDTEVRTLHQFLIQVQYLDPASEVFTTKIPMIFWQCVVMPATIRAAFRNANDAKALAIASCPTAEHLMQWQRFAQTGNADEFENLCLGFLENARDGVPTSAGDVYTEPDPMAIWFGSKAAAKTPHLVDDKIMIAFEKLFGFRTNEEIEDEKPAPTPAVKGKAGSVASEKPLIASVKQAMEFIDIDCIESDPENDRKTFDQAQLESLAADIRRDGFTVPINLRPIHGKNRFAIVAGERRWRAAKIAGLTHIPAIIEEREGLSLSLARLGENRNRVDLSPIEEAMSIKRLMDVHGLTQKQVGDLLRDEKGKPMSQGQVSNMLRLLNLPESLQKLVADGKIAPTFIRAILPYCDLPAVMDDVAKIFVKRLERPDAPDGRIEMRDVEQWIRTAIVNHSRPMKFQAHWSEYSNPSAKDRHFSKVSDENLKLLAPRKIDVMNDYEGKERTFNVKLFDELNKTPLANRREKHKAYKAKRGQNSGPAKATAKAERPFEHEWQVEHVLEAQMSKLLADAIEATKPSTMRQKLHAVVLTLAISSGESLIDEMAGTKTHFRKRVGEAAKKLDCSPAECDRFLQSIVVKDLRDYSHLDCSTAIAFAKMLGVDLVTAWAPNDELRKTLTDHGRQLLAEAEPGVPDFLLPFFGIEKKAAKAKKGKAA